MNIRKKSFLPIVISIYFFSSLIRAFLAILTVPWVNCPGVKGPSTWNWTVIGGAPSTILSFAVEVVGTGFFLCMEKRFGFSEVFGGEGLVGRGVGEGDLPLCAWYVVCLFVSLLDSQVAFDTISCL